MSSRRIKRFFGESETKKNPKIVVSENCPWVDYHVSLFVCRGLSETRVLGAHCLDSIRRGLGDSQFLKTLRKTATLNLGPILTESVDQKDMGSKIMDVLRFAVDTSYEELVNNLNSALRSRVTDLRGKVSVHPMEIRFENFQKNMELEIAEIMLLKLWRAMEMSLSFDDYIVKELDVFAKVNRSILAKVLDVSKDSISLAISGKLKSLDLDDSLFRGLKVPESLSDWNGLVKAPAPILTLQDFRLDAHSLELLKKLLSGPNSTPTHILFHGPKGVGKTQLARILAAEVKGEAFEIVHGFKSGDFLDNLVLAYNVLGAGRILIVDEADAMLKEAKPSLFSEKAPRKNDWALNLMVKKGPTCVWIIEDLANVSAEIKEFFTYNVKFEPLGAKARLAIWRRKQDDSKVTLVEDDNLRLLAKEFAVSQNVIERSFDKVLEIEPGDAKKANLWLKKLSRSNLELKGQRLRPIKISPRYRVEALTTDPPIKELLPTLKAWRDQAAGAPPDEREGRKMLLYGLPGSGKTEFVNYLAYELDLDLTHSRYSDVISQYVGQSEVNLANLFRKYESNLGILLIDEVESFLYKRDMAVRTYEMALVNEFLTCLDFFTGLFIGTTNRPDSLDQAARRRLGRKVEFKPLENFGKLELFKSFLEPMTKKPLSKTQLKRLNLLTQLVPSDYATVASNLTYADPKEIDNDAMLTALSQEVNARMGQLSQPAA
jgi:DNA polymerase III delta prime subunit